MFRKYPRLYHWCRWGAYSGLRHSSKHTISWSPGFLFVYIQHLYLLSPTAKAISYSATSKHRKYFLAVWLCIPQHIFWSGLTLLTSLLTKPWGRRELRRKEEPEMGTCALHTSSRHTSIFVVTKYTYFQNCSPD